MKKFLAIGVISLFLFEGSAIAEPVSTCEVIGDYVPIETEFPDREPDPARIDGNQPRSRVNVRTGPGQRFEAVSFVQVGDYVEVVGQAFSSNCDTWAKVRIPVTRQTGWVRSDFIEFTYARGWWT